MLMLRDFVYRFVVVSYPKEVSDAMEKYEK